MYTHIWNKYLPIIKILLKKSAAAEQKLALNRIDFERAGSGRKSGYKFTIHYVKGKVSNVISSSPLASDLAVVINQDGILKNQLAENDYDVILNTKFELTIKNTTLQPEPEVNN
jgi:hypothetical protein